MCNRYASHIRKAGKEKEYYGFDEWSETRINTILDGLPKECWPDHQARGRRKVRMVSRALGLAGPAKHRRRPRHQHPQHQEPDRGVLFLAGICGEWYGDHGTKKEPNVGTHKLFSFLTTEANDRVSPVHAKAMPVILRTEAEGEEWLSAPADRVEATGIDGL